MSSREQLLYCQLVKGYYMPSSRVHFAYGGERHATLIAESDIQISRTFQNCAS